MLKNKETMAYRKRKRKEKEDCYTLDMAKVQASDNASTEWD